MKKLLSLFVLLVAIVTGAWAGETFSFTWTAAGTKGYSYSQAGLTSGSLITNNAIYFVSNEGPKVESSKLNPYRVGFVFKPASDVTLKIKGAAGSSARTIQNIKIDVDVDSRFYALCKDAVGSSKTVMQYALDNATDEDKAFYATVGILKVSKGVYSVAGDAKSVSGQDAQTALYDERVSANNIAIEKNSEGEGDISTGSPAKNYTFKAGKCYRIYTEASSSTGTQVISFTFEAAQTGPVDPVLTVSKASIGTNETAKILLGGEDTFGDNFTAGTLWESASGGPYITLGVDGTITPIKATPAGYYFTFTATAKDATKYNTVTGNQIDITVTNPTCVAPEITPATFTTDNQEVTMSTETTGATIYYTTDGTDPTTESSAYDGENKPTVSSTTTFKAIAVKDGYDNSTITTQKVARTASALVGDWDFTNWSSATQTGVKGDTEAWNQYEKTGSAGMNFGENGRSNVSAISSGSTLKYSTTNIEETDGLTFAAGDYGLGLIFNIGSATVSSTEYTYHGSSYLWLYNKNAIITIPSVPAGATIEIGVESHNGGNARGVTLKNGSTSLTQTQGEATSTSYQVCKWTNATAGNVTVTPSAGLHIYYIKVTGNAETVPVSTTSGNTYATYVTQNDLDFSSVSSDITAYITLEADANATKIPTQAVTKVPANTAILVKTAEAGATVNVPVAATTPAALSANTMQHSASPVAGDGSTIFGFFKVSGQYGFAPVKIGTSLAAGKGYIVIPEGNSGSFLAIDFEEEATAVETVAEAKANTVAPVKVIKNGKLIIGNYNVAGQQVK